MSFEIAETPDDLVDDTVSANQPYNYEFVGGALVQDAHTLRLSEEVLGAVEKTRRIIERARDVAAAPAAVCVVPIEDAGIDVGGLPFDDFLGRVTLVGAIENGIEDEIEVQEGAAGFPLTARLYQLFRGAGDPKFVRVDTVGSYRDFRASQSPEMAELAAKVAELDEVLRQHMADGHGGQAVVQGYLDDISRLQGSAEERVPLSMPPWAEGKWDCWRTGDVICSSIAVCGADGEPRIITAATPVRKHVENVVGCTHAVGCDVPELLGVLPTIACMLGGGSLIPEMAAAVPSALALSAGREPFVGRIVPVTHPSLAALIALLQKAQQGDQQATKEWAGLCEIAEKDRDLASAMVDAQKRLVRAQKRKK